MDTITTSEIKERIIELNFYLIQSINKGDNEKVEAIRIEMNSLIQLYLKK